MTALVVFESMYGNTRTIAEAVAEGLSGHTRTALLEVSQAPARIAGDVQLLVVGGPTHAFGMSRASTREQAAQDAPGPLVSSGPGIREWLASLDSGNADLSAATFDTRVDRPRFPGSAARAARRRLRAMGLSVTEPPQSFYVHGSVGPLLDGERDRAQRWGEQLALTFCGARH
jgi:hypothetical protein